MQLSNTQSAVSLKHLGSTQQTHLTAKWDTKMWLWFKSLRLFWLSDCMSKKTVFSAADTRSYPERRRDNERWRTIRPSLTLLSPGSRSHRACVRGQRSQAPDSPRAETSHACTDKSICCHWFTSVWGLLRDQLPESRGGRLNTDHVCLLKHWYLGKYAYLISCWEWDVNVDTTFISLSVNY